MSKILADAMEKYNNNQLYSIYIEDNLKRLNKAKKGGTGQYMPCPRENKEMIRQEYIDFISSLGIKRTLTNKVTPVKRTDYPALNHIALPDFNSFVAYDFETTGLSDRFDSPIEIGAIKVINGQVIESKEYIFQELIKPYKAKISPQITNLTGITNEDVKDAREMWEVMKDFFEFAGDLPLVGYNSKTFDTKFLIRCGRYCNHIIKNDNFDTYLYAKRVGIPTENLKLGTISSYLGIHNPRAHRALADAITTARVLEELKKL